jgi:hypothetical protein
LIRWRFKADHDDALKGGNFMLKVTGKLFWTALPVLAMAVCPQAHAQLFCSNAMLEGSFAVVISGQSGVPANPAPRSGVSMTRFDGQGGLTDTAHIVANGVQPPANWRSATGTYTVNPDCTGVFVVNYPAPETPLIVFFAVGNGGRAFRGVVGLPGANITVDGTRLETSFF